MPQEQRLHRAGLMDRLRELGEAEATETAVFQQVAAARYGLGVIEMKALSVLLHSGPQTAGSLGTALGVTSGAVTGVVDRLQRRGFARRRHDDADRRRIIVEADAETLAAGDNVYRDIGQAFTDLYDSYTTAELEFLVRYLTSAVDIIRTQIHHLKTRPHQPPDTQRPVTARPPHKRGDSQPGSVATTNAASARGAEGHNKH